MNKSNGIVQAKEEYTKELINLLREPLCDKFLQMYNNTVVSTKNKRDLIVQFQYALKEIPLWNQSLIDFEVNKIVTKCEFFNDLVAAIFVTNVKILSSVKMGKEKQKIQVTMPKTDQFIHKIYINTAHTLYNNPYIFSSQYDPQKRKAEILVFSEKSIEDTIRTMLPFRNILQNYLGTTVDEESDSSDTESETKSVKSDKSFNDEPETEQYTDFDTEQELEPSEPPEPTEHVDEPSFNESTQENQESTGGFFDQPSEHVTNDPFEPKTVPINNPPSALQQQQPNELPPPLFPDAADDPEA